MGEDAGFIQAILDDPDERTVMLVYADWLDERNDPRGEYLRLLVSGCSDKEALTQLRRTLDPGWVPLIEYRRFRVGDRVRMLYGRHRRMEGRISEIATDRWSASVFIVGITEPHKIEIALAALERLA